MKFSVCRLGWGHHCPTHILRPHDFIGGLIMAALYNLTAGWVGGISVGSGLQRASLARV